MYYNWKENTNTEQLKVICNLIKNGEDIQKIIKYTGLTKKEIENITKTED